MEISGTVRVTKLTIKLASWEKKIIYNEFSAAVFVSIEKKKNKTTRLIGPPPMPKKEDIMPRKSPITIHTRAFVILYV